MALRIIGMKDDTQSISLYINGGRNLLNAKSLLAGGTGVALWDAQAGHAPVARWVWPWGKPSTEKSSRASCAPPPP